MKKKTYRNIKKYLAISFLIVAFATVIWLGIQS